MMYENCKVVILKEKETLPQRDWKKEPNSDDPYNEENWEEELLPKFRYQDLSHHYSVGNYHDVLRADLVLLEKTNGEIKIIKNRFQ